jgi:antitoxin component of RelBE/YafQ-DinJ toxin-antitoxin module
MKTERINIRIEKELVKKAKAYKLKSGITISQQIRTALKKFLEL